MRASNGGFRAIGYTGGETHHSMAQWDKVLKSLGFTDSEAKIYLASIELGPTPVQDLAKKAGVSRVTGYAAIEALMADGLMSTVQKGKKTLYMAESPERLVSFVHGRMKTMEGTLREIEGAIGELKLMQRGEKPVVRLFEGREALKAIQDDVLQTKPDRVDEFGNIDEIDKIYRREELVPFYDKLAAMRPKGHTVLLTKGTGLKNRNPERRLAALSPKKFSFTGDIFIYGDKLALSTFRGKQIAVIIESADLADTVRAMNDLLWSCLDASDVTMIPYKGDGPTSDTKSP